MPIESSKAQIGGNLGLDFGSYIQGKSFTRSVSISEAPPVASTTDCTGVSDGTATSSTFPTVTRFASGGPAASDISPSPFSSATATISPDSPLPTSGLNSFPAPFSITLDQLTASSDPMASSGVHTGPLSESSQNPSLAVVPEGNVNSTVSQSTPLHNRLVIPELTSLLQHTPSHRTVNLLSHLIDSRLTPEWRDALIYTWSTASRPISLNVSQSVLSPNNLSSNGASTAIISDTVVVQPVPIDRTDSAAVRRPNPPTPSPSEENVATKRSRPNDHKPFPEQNESPSPTFSSTTLVPSSSVPVKPDSVNTVPSTFIPLRLIQCVCRLANHFESCYRDKLGDLLDDVARLSSPHSADDTTSTGSIPVTSEEPSCTESNGVNEFPRDDHFRSSNFLGEDSVNEQLLISARTRFHTVLSELFAERVNWGRVIAMLAFVRSLCVFVERRRIACSAIRSTELNPSRPDMFQIARNRSSSDQSKLHVNNSNITGQSVDVGGEGSSSMAPSADVAAGDVFENENQTTTTTTLSANAGESRLIEHNSPIRAAHYVAWAAEFIHGPHGIWQWIAAHGGWEGLISFESDRGISDPQADQSLLGGGFTEDEAMRLLRRAVMSVAPLAAGAVGLVGAVGILAALRYLAKRL